MLRADLELASVVLIAEANSHDLAAVDTERAAILDNDAAALAARQPQDDLVTHMQGIRSGCRRTHHESSRYHQARGSPSAWHWSAATLSSESASTFSALRQAVHVPRLTFTGSNASLASFASMSW